MNITINVNNEVREGSREGSEVRDCNINREQAGIENNADRVGETTLADLLEMLGDVTKMDKIPTPKKLRETAGEPILAEKRCKVYSNGYAVYDNGSGRTVLWVPDWQRFSFYFNPLKDSEKSDDMQERLEVPKEEMLRMYWSAAVTMVADHRVESNLMNRTGSRTGTRDYDTDDKGDKDDGAQRAAQDPYEKEYYWKDDRFGESPETAYIRKETLQEALKRMTEKQREAFILYYKYGYKQHEIADFLKITQKAVDYRLDGAVSHLRKN